MAHSAVLSASGDGASVEAVALRVLIVLASAIVMEGVAHLVHRWWMHGPGWGWHRSHHEPGRGNFERNDLYALVFAALAIAGFALGHGRWWPLYWVALGVTLYGLLYALVHDGLVHRRWPWRWHWTPRSGYLARLVQAHRLHHAVHSREGCVSFGFLLAAPPARLAAALKVARGRAQQHGPPAARTPAPPSAPTPAPAAQGLIGLGLAATVAGARLALLVWALWLLPLQVVVEWSRVGVPPGWAPMAALLLVAGLAVILAVSSWLNVGLFIIAHDALHGALWPGRRQVNRVLGQLFLLLYGGFLLSRFRDHHLAHHRHSGTAGDPDFHPEARRFWPWYLAFMRRYTGWREIAAMATIAVLLHHVLRAPWLNLLLFWALPALMSSLQLFAFGTWLPHRHTEAAFADTHNARSSGLGSLGSLFSCFHFGHHHEHHLCPGAPWWRLPALRRAHAAGRLQRTVVTRADGSTAARAPQAPARPRAG